MFELVTVFVSFMFSTPPEAGLIAIARRQTGGQGRLTYKVVGLTHAHAYFKDILCSR